MLSLVGIVRDRWLAGRRPAIRSIAAFAGLFALLLQVPDHVANNSHDFGSQAAVEFWIQHRLRFGIDVIQNVGPFGYLAYRSIFTGILDLPKFFLNALLTALFAWLLLEVRIPSRRDRYAFLATAALLVSNDAFLYLLVLLLAHGLLAHRRAAVAALFLGALSLLSLSKGSLFFMGAVAVAGVAATRLLQREATAAAACLFGYVAWSAVLFLAAGQSLASAPDFVLSQISFSSGYNGAMQAFERPVTTALGFALLAATALASTPLFGRYRDGRPRYQWVPMLLVDWFILFAVWKHGYVRADWAHVPTFVVFALVACAYFLWRAPAQDAVLAAATAPESSRWPNRHVALAWFVAFVALADFCSMGIFPVLRMLQMHFVQVRSKLVALSDPVGFVSGLRGALAESAADMKSPAIRRAVGDQPVAYLGMLPGFMVYNDLNYVPTPATISFAAWNERSLLKDAEFLAADAAPRFVVVSLQTIDNRFLPQEEGPAKMALLDLYRPVLIEGNNLLMVRAPVGGGDVTWQMSHSEIHSAGEWVQVPQASPAVTVRLRLECGLLARSIGVVYKPLEVGIEYELADGRRSLQRLVPGIAAVGFLMNPTLFESGDFAAAKSRAEYARYQAGESKVLHRVLRFRIVVAHSPLSCGRRFEAEFGPVGIPGLGSLE